MINNTTTTIAFLSNDVKSIQDNGQELYDRIDIIHNRIDNIVDNQQKRNMITMLRFRKLRKKNEEINELSNLILDAVKRTDMHVIESFRENQHEFAKLRKSYRSLFIMNIIIWLIVIVLLLLS